MTPQELIAVNRLLLAHELLLMELLFALHESGGLPMAHAIERLEWARNRFFQDPQHKAAVDVIDRVLFGLRNATPIGENGEPV